MRLGVGIVVLSLLVGSPAMAEHLVIPDQEDTAAIRYDMSQRDQTEPYGSQRADTNLVERPVVEVIAAKLGVAQGRVELFRYHLEGAPSGLTDMRAVMDGGGVKLKITW